jgi:hypothetical protein
MYSDTQSYIVVISFVVHLPYQEFRILYSHVFRSRSHFENVIVENMQLALIAPELLARLEFFIDLNLPTALWHWIDSASNRND